MTDNPFKWPSVPQGTPLSPFTAYEDDQFTVEGGPDYSRDEREQFWQDVPVPPPPIERSAPPKASPFSTFASGEFLKQPAAGPLALGKMAYDYYSSPERYQFWPERLARAGARAAGDTIEEGLPTAGLRREDFTDEPAPGTSTISGPRSNRQGWARVPWQPSDKMVERAQDMSGLMAGSTAFGGLGGATLGMGVVLPAKLRARLSQALDNDISVKQAWKDNPNIDPDGPYMQFRKLKAIEKLEHEEWGSKEYAARIREGMEDKGQISFQPQEVKPNPVAGSEYARTARMIANAPTIEAKTELTIAAIRNHDLMPYAQQMSDPKLAEKLGVALGQIERLRRTRSENDLRKPEKIWASRQGATEVAVPTPPDKKPNMPNVDWDEVTRLLLSGKSYREIEVLTGVSRSALNRRMHEMPTKRDIYTAHPEYRKQYEAAETSKDRKLITDLWLDWVNRGQNESRLPRPGSPGRPRTRDYKFYSDPGYQEEIKAAKTIADKERIQDRWRKRETNNITSDRWAGPRGESNEPIEYADGGPVAWGATPVDDNPISWGATPVESDAGWGGYASVAGRGLAQGAIAGVGKALQGIPELYSEKPRETAIARAGQAIEEFAKEQFPLKPEEEKSLTGQVASTIGTVAPVVAAAPLTGGLGAVAIGAGQMGLIGAADQASRARDKGASPQTAREAAIWGAVGNAVLGALPFHVILRPLERASPAIKDWAIAKLKAAGQSGVTFGGVGEVQHWLGEEIAKEFYDPAAGYHPDAERAAVGLLSGAILGGVRRVPVREQQPKEPIIPERAAQEIQEPRVVAEPSPDQAQERINRLLAGENTQLRQQELVERQRRQEQEQTEALTAERQQVEAQPQERAQERQPSSPEIPPVSIMRPQELALDPQRFRATMSEPPTPGMEKKLTTPILAFADEAGRTTVVDGNRRVEAALAQGLEQIPVRIMRQAEGITPDYARAVGTYQNLAEGTGGREAARILQAAPQGIAERLGGIPSSERIVQDAKALAALSPEGFGLVSKGKLPASYAAEVARLVQEQTAQLRSLYAVSRAKPENIDQVRRIVQETLSDRTAINDGIRGERAELAQERQSNENLLKTLQAEAGSQRQAADQLSQTAQRIERLGLGQSQSRAAPAIPSIRPGSLAGTKLEGVQSRAAPGGDGPAGGRPSIFPRRINLERIGDDKFAIRAGDDVVGEVKVSNKRKSNLKIEMIESRAEDKANSLGPAAIREVKRELKKEYPEARAISGKRVGGARIKYDEGAMPINEPVNVKSKLSITPAAERKSHAIERELTKLAEQQIGKHVKIEFADKVYLKKADLEGYGDAFGKPRTAGGIYYPAEKIIKLALGDPKYPDRIGVLNHESFHVVQDLLATPKELGVLKREDGRLRKYIQELGFTPEQAKALSSTEVQANAYNAWIERQGKPEAQGLPATVGSLFNRIKTFLRKVRNVMSGLGFKTSEDVFKSVQSGEMAGREALEPGRFVREALGEESGLASAPPPVAEPAQPMPPTGPKISPASAPATLPEPPSTMGPTARKFSNYVDRLGLGDIVRDIQIKLTPMAARDATIESRAAAKDFANGLQEARYTQTSLDDVITKSFTPEQQKRMWQAADEESVARQRGETTKGIGLDKLAPNERAVVERLQARADETFAEAKRLGIYEGADEGLPSYVTRLVLMKTPSGGFERPNSGMFAKRLYGPRGSALRTTTPQMLERKYLTVEETESAAKEKFGPGAEVLKNIRVLPYSTGLLQEAIAGRKLIDRIKEVGKEAQADVVAVGEKPQGNWFTIDHPAFYNAREVNGTIQRTPIFVRSDFEGPLRSVLEQKNGSKIYQALMALKGKTMSIIMFSPMIHNQVEFGRAMPAMPGKVITGRIYFEGNKAKNDPEIMRESIRAGLTPIGHRGFLQDISSVPELPNLKPGRSWTADILAYIPGLFSKSAGNAVKRSIDKAGDFWHNTMLWDRIGDLQMGLYTNLRDNMIKKGFDPVTSQRAAAHWANRYAGAIPLEAMSANARKLANVMMFSRSFTLGNIGAMKDIAVGLPRDVQAQIARDAGLETLDKIKSVARRKALSIVAIDIALFYAMTSALQSAFNTMGISQAGATVGGAAAGGLGGYWALGPVGGVAGTIAGGYLGNQAVSSDGKRTLDEELQAYKDRFGHLLTRIKENPLDVLNPFKMVESISATSENEPNRKDRVRAGEQEDKTAIYMRLPLGKIGEELMGYIPIIGHPGPLEMAHRKLSTWARPLSEIWSNKTGLGNDKIFEPHPEGVKDQVKATGDIVLHIMKSQAPVDWVQSIVDTATDQGDKTTNVLKSVGPLLGATFSKGAPTGPEMGEYYGMKEKHEFEVSKNRDKLRRLIEAGKTEEAIELMTSLKMDQKEKENYMRIYSGVPRMNNRKMDEFMKRGTPEQIEHMQRQMTRGALSPQAPSGPESWGATPVRP